MNDLQKQVRVATLKGIFEKIASDEPTNREKLTAMLTPAVEKEAAAEPTNVERMTAMLTPTVEKEAGGKEMLNSLNNLYKTTVAGGQAHLLTGAYKGLQNQYKKMTAPAPAPESPDYLADAGNWLKEKGQNVGDYVQNTLMKPDQWGPGTNAAVYGGGGALAAILAAMAARKMMS